MINFSKPSSPSEPKINCALTPIVSLGAEFNLHSNDFIIERLSIRPIDAVKGHFDLSVSRKYLIAKVPEWQVIYRSMLQKQDLKNLQFALEKVLLEQNEHAPSIKD
jgi:hypothetical protein